MPAERKTVPIALGVIEGPDARRAIESIVEREVHELARDGWAPDQGLDFESLKRSGTFQEVGSMFRGGQREFASVTVRLKRER